MLAELQNITKTYTNAISIPEKASKLSNVSHRASGIQTPILNGISLSIGPGDSIAVVGPSGSGKSTLLNILGTLDKPTSGQVILNGKNLETLNDDALSAIRNKFIGFVFQLHHLLPQLTLLENVMLPVLPVKDKTFGAGAKERALGLLERVGLLDHVRKHPYQLSVGECQRTALVRALINQPKLLLADEPTGSLDGENAARLADLLKAINHELDVAVVLATHSNDLALAMGKRYRLSAGILNLLS